jgi:hypothetical protein
MHRYIYILVVGLAVTTSASAQSWADRLFDTPHRDFGSVPHGAVVTHPFRIVNNSGQVVQISNVRVSCGCVTAQALSTYIKPGQETVVLAHMDTKRFQGPRTVTVYVTFDRPSYAEVRLTIQANSRSDVSITPDTLSFGRVKRASTPEKSVGISLMGGSEYRILSVSCDSNYVHPVCTYTGQNGYELTYNLTTKLRSDTPPGRWYTDVWITTNNPSMTKVRIPLTVEIESSLSVSPGTVLLGKVKAGTEEARKIIIRGVEPFRILEVKGGDKDLKITDSTNEKATVHVLTIAFRPDQVGDLNRTLYVVTDLSSDNIIDFQTRAQVVP